MVKRFLIISILLFIPGIVLAQSPTPTISLSQGTWEAVKQYCIKPTSLGEDREHLVKLEGSIGKANTPYELWRFTDGNNKWQCAQDSSGAATCADIEQAKTASDFKILSNTKQDLVSDAAGAVSISKVYSHTADKMNHYFFALAPYTAETTKAGDNWSLKLAQIVPTTGDITKCGKVTWDPEGTVFDAVSLEPIPGASITLLNNQKSIYPVGVDVRQNPQTTTDSGHYSFFTPDGTYFLESAKMGYRQLTDAEKTQLQQRLNALASQTGKQLYYNLYTNSSEPIVQKGKLEHRDIPLMPESTEAALKRKPMIIGVSILKNGQEQLISGTASIPFATIEVYQGLKQITTATSDQFGAFTVSIPNKDIDPMRPLEVVAIKDSALFGAAAFGSDANRSVPAQVYPVPVYVEGYVYNDKLVVPNAIVSVVVPDLNRTLITVQADKNGYVTIPPEYIPTTPFVLAMADANKQPFAQTTTATFIEQNKNTMQAQKINLFNPSADAKITASTIIPFTTGTDAKQTYIFPTGVKEPTRSASSSPTTSSDTSMTNQFLALIVTMVLAVLFGGILILVARKKNQAAKQNE